MAGIYFEKLGDWSDASRTPVVMLRGLGRSSRYWLGVDRAIASGRPVLVTDARGLGRSQKPMGWTDSVWDMADDAIEAMDAAGVKQGHIFGISLGGMVSIALGIRYPNRVKSLMLGCTSLFNFRVPRATFHAAWVVLTSPMHQKSKMSERLLTVLISDVAPEARKREIITTWDTIVADEGLPSLTVLKQLAASFRFGPWKAVRALSAPTLVLVGDRDAFVPIENSKMVAKAIAGSQLVVIRDGGHEFTDDHVDETAKLVLDFAERQGA